jgi:CxxC motif-containing protein (DUF1111 family)
MVRRGVIILVLNFAAPAAAASLDAEIGRRLFERVWVSAPSSTQSNDGLGPLYDAPSCASCHVRNPLADLDDTTVPPGTVVRLGNAKGQGDPIYGLQLQTRAVRGHNPEANPDITWTSETGLRTATITLYSQNYGALASETKMALRRAPVLNGAGLLAQIPESEILKRADPDDTNGDGIKGRAAFVDAGKKTLGRFGWKAAEPDLPSQIAKAFSIDIGMSTSLRPEPSGDCTEAQAECRKGPHGARGGEVEIAKPLVDSIVEYLKELPSPASASAPGMAQFDRIGCGACHAVPRLADGTPVPAYTDLLLHDLGDGLNDGIKEGVAEAGLWRTAPLWNVGKALAIGGLLHDGRARSIEEAVEWHGGEAAGARAKFRALTRQDKAALAGFVRGL